MTKQEYDAYVQAVNNFFDTEGINCLTPVNNTYHNSEPYFSSRDCECCKRSLAGDRYDCEGYSPERSGIYEYSVCADCVYFAEYGQLDDMTMLDISE